MRSIQSTRIYLLVLLVVIFSTIQSLNAIKRGDSNQRKLDGDFEFADEEEAKTNRKEGKKTWILDPGRQAWSEKNCGEKEPPDLFEVGVVYNFIAPPNAKLGETWIDFGWDGKSQSI
ncbi:unnamed protein product [Allacma fusca]|uniref:Uncharacterized protein n=1 Tax=Allacma fusca TaxID=39272 RepID=A0A8J2KV55_9HEXA|nr:unnamed protein product [Allacma fusca]